MLSRRQAWRRRTQVIHREEHDFIYKEDLYQCSFKNRSASDPTLSGKGDFNNLEKTWSSTGNLTDTSKPMCPEPYIPAPPCSGNSSTRKVRWNLGVRVVLIPTRAEYKDIGLTDLIWWNENDYCIFRNGAAEELENAVDYFQVDAKEAVKLLYQPEFDAKCLFLEQSPRLERLATRGLHGSDSFDTAPKMSPVPTSAPINSPSVTTTQDDANHRES